MIAPVAERGETRRPGRRLGRGFGRAALMIGVLTVLARVVGFGRQVVFAHTVGTSCLGTAYTTANMVPNIIYDIVLGGALSSVVVPVLARSARLSREQTRQISSALLTWTVVLLLPVSALVAIAARPIVTAALSGASGCPPASLAGVATRMLIVFAPQVLLYGLAVVLYGILQAHRRFGAPALAPLLSSLVVVGAYAGFGVVGGVSADHLENLPAFPEYLLSGGTTLGVAMLVATAVVPAWRLRLRPRLTLRFPPDVGARVRKLALAGVVTLVAQDASVAMVIVLANRYGHSGALVLYGFAWAVFVVPFAVLAVPVATSAFPELAELSREGADIPREDHPPYPPGHARWKAGSAGHAALSPDDPAAPVPDPGPRPPGGGAPADGEFDETAAASTRAVLLASMLGTAALIGARTPVARIFESHSVDQAWVLSTALVTFAPALIGYGLSANLSRVQYALGRNLAPALAVSAGWLLVIVADLAMVPFLPRARVVPALGLGTTIGLTIAGVTLLLMVRRERGNAPLRGMWRAFGAGTAGCLCASAAGSGLAMVIRVAGFFPNAAVAVVVTAVVAGVFAAVVVTLDGGDARNAITRLRPSRRPAPR
jgi:putative peptidoglycan lipid II flippase